MPTGCAGSCAPRSRRRLRSPAQALRQPRTAASPRRAASPNAENTRRVLRDPRASRRDLPRRRDAADRLHRQVPPRQPSAHGRRRPGARPQPARGDLDGDPGADPAAIGLVVFFELPKIENAPASANPIHITVEGHQYYWQFNYPNGARSINDLHVPQGEVVDLDVVSADVIHSWWIPELGGKIEAIAGRTNKPGSTRRARARSSASAPSSADLPRRDDGERRGDRRRGYHTVITTTAKPELGRASSAAYARRATACSARAPTGRRSRTTRS